GATTARRGWFSWAAVAGPPSPLVPATPVPATVTMVPFTPTARIRWSPVSATYTDPSDAPATPVGAESLAATAGPPSPHAARGLAHGDPVPAIVVIVPLGATRRTLWLPVSATSTDPSCPVATPCGADSFAATAGPPSPLDPAAPVPATVVMTPDASA